MSTQEAQTESRKTHSCTAYVYIVTPPSTWLLRSTIQVQGQAAKLKIVGPRAKWYNLHVTPATPPMDGACQGLVPSSKGVLALALGTC